MNYFTTVALCATINLSSARPQFGGNPFLSNQNQWRPNQFAQDQFAQNQFFPNGGVPNQGFPNQFEFQPNPNNQYFPSSPNANLNERPGNSNRPNQFLQQRPNGNQQTTTIRPQVPGARPAQSPASLNCQSQCLTTNEYNPVCGDNTMTYSNERKLDCANQCGRRLNQNWRVIQIERPGACESGQRVP